MSLRQNDGGILSSTRIRGSTGHTINSRRTVSRPPFSEQPLCELAHLWLAGGEPRFDDEIRTRSNQRLFERCDERARFDEIADQRLTAGRGADSEEKHEPVCDIDTAAADSLKALDLEWPIREVDIGQRLPAGVLYPSVLGGVTSSGSSSATSRG